ncbi:MAG TPA: hypothetical protein VK148_06775 [Xanthobacteraceae bacterium]|jgi:uncharacterized protein YjbJ (UPF0337 family)|nr:hypothetical protein [Xanthobacteraceae bacterium]
MAEERIQGTVRSFGGKLEEGIGKAMTKTEAGGLIDQAAGAVEDAYGKTKDGALEAADAVKGAAVETHDFLRKYMEDNPHTTTVVALGLGLLIGYAAHREPPRRHWWD